MRSAIAKNPTPHVNFTSLHGSMFYRTGVIADRSFALLEWGIFNPRDLELDPITFIHEFYRRYTG